MSLLSIFIEHPWLALVPAAAFALLADARRSRFAGLVAALWAAYTAYELAMKHRLLCTGECNIRIDLLLIYPVLVVVSLIALVTGRRRVPR